MPMTKDMRKADTGSTGCIDIIICTNQLFGANRKIIV